MRLTADTRTLIQCAIEGNTAEAETLLNSTDAKKELVNQTDSAGRTPLHHAVRNDRLDFVKFLVENGADPNAITLSDESTPLHYACVIKTKKKPPSVPPSTDLAAAFAAMQRTKQGLLPSTAQTEETVLGYLLANCPGIYINKQNKYGQTPLHLTAVYENLQAYQSLVKHKVDLEVKDKQEMRALHLAASRKDPAVAEELISDGAEVLCTDLNLSTPLHIAAEEGNLSVARALLNKVFHGERKKMLGLKDRMGNTCLHSAVLNNRSDCVVYFIQSGGDLSSPNHLGRTPLHLAAMVGDSNIIEKIRSVARMDIDLNAHDCDDETPLHKAAAYADARALVSLLEPNTRQNIKLDLDLNIRNSHDCTAFLIAAKFGRVQCIAKLLDEPDLKWDAVDTDKKTAVCLAAEGNHADAVDALLDDSRMLGLINEGDSKQMNPLLIASKLGHTDVMKTLIHKGADLGVKNTTGMSALHLAAKYGHLDIVKMIRKRLPMLLFDKDDKINTALHRAAKAGHIRVVNYLIQENSDLSAKNDKALTPLGSAVVGGWQKCSTALLDARSDISTTDNNQNTLLHHACIRGYQPIAELLIERGISLAEIDLDCKNCLDLAIDHRHPHIVQTILNKEKTEKSQTEWKDALRKQHQNDTPMRKLVREMPEMAEVVLTKSMSMKDGKVTFNYEFVDDMQAMKNWRTPDQSGKSFLSGADQMDSGEYKKNHIMNVMVKSQRLELIDHPLVSALLRKKWTQSTRFMFGITFLIYMCFLGFLTGYMVAITPPYEENTTSTLNNFQGSDTCEKLEASGRRIDASILVTKYFIIVLAAILVFIEIGQFFQARLNYLSFENLMEWIILVFTFLLVVDLKQCQMNTGYRYDWQWSLGAMALFLGWVNLVMFIQRFPRFGIYIVMFRDIFTTFLEFFLVYILFIIAFALGFYSLMRNAAPFASFGLAFMKTAVMMTGEFEFGDLFLDANTPLYHSFTSYLLFLGLTITLSIIVMNLLVGLAVDNIKEIQDKAALTRLKMQVDLVLEVESLMPKNLKFKLAKISPKSEKSQKVKQNTKSQEPESYIEVVDLNEVVCSWLPFKLHRMFGPASDGITKAKVMKALQPDKTEMRQLQDDNFHLHQQNEKVRARIKTVETQMSKMMKMMEITMQKLDIKLPDDGGEGFGTVGWQ